MPATLENIKGRDLPPAWRRTAQVKDDEIVSVTITPQSQHTATKTPNAETLAAFDEAKDPSKLLRYPDIDTAMKDMWDGDDE